MKFKVGDRVAFYNSYERIVAMVCECDPEGHDGMIRVMWKVEGRERFHYAYPQQCRRLVKSKPRLRVFLGPAAVSELRSFDRSQRKDAESTIRLMPYCANSDEWVEFVEVRRKKK